MCTLSFGQETKKQELEWFAYWGWNRAWYTHSNIHLKGEGYNFTLQSVEAHDRPTHFTPKLYFGFKTMSIPQTNFRIGAKINNKWSISGGVDHMKYVVDQHQTVTVDGNQLPDNFPEVDSDNEVNISPDWFNYEHTDGLNYINFELRRHINVFQVPKISMNVFAGAGLGGLLPKTNATVFGNPRNDAFHLAGFGAAGVAGINLTFFKHFFLQSEFKSGGIVMPDVRTTPNKSDKASQSFGFAQWNFVIGMKL